MDDILQCPVSWGCQAAWEGAEWMKESPGCHMPGVSSEPWVGHA